MKNACTIRSRNSNVSHPIPMLVGQRRPCHSISPSSCLNSSPVLKGDCCDLVGRHLRSRVTEFLTCSRLAAYILRCWRQIIFAGFAFEIDVAVVGAVTITGRFTPTDLSHCPSSRRHWSPRHCSPAAFHQASGGCCCCWWCHRRWRPLTICVLVVCSKFSALAW